MKGDLHTLQKVCGYASKVMLLGEAVIAAVILAVAVLGLTSPFVGWSADALSFIAGLRVPSDLATYADLARVLFILVLGLFTVFTVRLLMISVSREHSPFTLDNVRPMVAASKVYLLGAVVIGALTFLATESFGETVFVFFGCVLISVVLYCFGLMIRYGAVLQDESDHTL